MIGLAISCLPLNISLPIKIYSLQMPHRQTHQESNLTTLSTPFYKARQTRHFLKHVKHAILWSPPSTPFYEARQARHFMKHAKHAIS